jgi:hypothetical protein
MTQVPADDVPSVPVRQPRPAGVVIVSVLLLLGGLTYLLAASGMTIPFVTGGMFSLLSTDDGRVFVLAVAALCALDAVAFFMGWRWGWALAMLLTGLGLVFNLAAYANGDFNVVRLILLVAAALYLNQRAVREVFDRPRRASVVTPAG